MTFEHWYFFEWHYCFDDISAQSFPLQNVFFPIAALVPQYVLNQANQQRLLPGLGPEELPVLR